MGAEWKGTRIYTQGRKETRHMELELDILLPSSSSAIPELRQPKNNSCLEGGQPSILDSLELVHQTNMKGTRKDWS